MPYPKAFISVVFAILSVVLLAFYFNFKFIFVNTFQSKFKLFFRQNFYIKSVAKKRILVYNRSAVLGGELAVPCICNPL